MSRASFESSPSLAHHAFAEQRETDANANRIFSFLLLLSLSNSAVAGNILSRLPFNLSDDQSLDLPGPATQTSFQ